MFRHFILLTVFLIVCSAIPNKNTYPERPLLTRPAPINPDIPSDPKPQERILPIPQGHEIKQKRETDLKNDATNTQHPPLPGPLSLPHEQNQDVPKHSQFKRDSLDKSSPSSIPTNLRGPQTLLKNKENSHEHSHEHNYQHERENVKQSTITNVPKTVSTSKDSLEKTYEINRRPYTPSLQQSNHQSHNKRDIPVPVTESEKEKASTTTKPSDKSTQQPSHPAVLNQPIPVAELLRTKSE